MKRIRLLLMTAILVLGLAVPAFADKGVNIDIYKDGSTTEHSMAQKAIKSARITDDNYLVVETKYFQHMLIWGTLKQLAYNVGDNNIVKSSINQATPNNDGQVSILLSDSIVNNLNDPNNKEGVWLNKPGVKSSVVIIGEHTPNDYRAVNIKLSLVK